MARAAQTREAGTPLEAMAAHLEESRVVQAQTDAARLAGTQDVERMEDPAVVGGPGVVVAVEAVDSHSTIAPPIIFAVALDPRGSAWDDLPGPMSDHFYFASAHRQEPC